MINSIDLYNKPCMYLNICKCMYLMYVSKCMYLYNWGGHMDSPK